MGDRIITGQKIKGLSLSFVANEQDELKSIINEHTGEVYHIGNFNDAYWLRMFSGMAIQGKISHDGPFNSFNMVHDFVELSSSLIKEIKKHEQENEKKD